MFCLPLDVGNGVGFLRDANGEGTVPFLHQANCVLNFSFIQCDDAPFINCMALANGKVAGNESRMCT